MGTVLSIEYYKGVAKLTAEGADASTPLTLRLRSPFDSAHPSTPLRVKMVSFFMPIEDEARSKTRHEHIPVRLT